ncbi:MAG TPA: GxxExxY protein [Holophaga sp.]|nr:GxxExxY protein [Holophaga sp.]
MDANEDLLFKDEVFAIVGAAMEVHSVLGPGFLEAVYGDALALESASRQIPFARETPIQVTYKDQPLTHTYRADFLAWGRILIALKAVRTLGDIERAQAINYMRATRHPLAILLNFGAPRLDWMRLVLTQ